ncbi:hypothetical protein S1OALGB6SA_1838 [Olavius algarvensis spirochete endosymbiont]|nr:hypothetical protein S1OALGB6SA_1838 [Olavius algarvensis spirochete endosymbiont]
MNNRLNDSDIIVVLASPRVIVASGMRKQDLSGELGSNSSMTEVLST